MGCCESKTTKDSVEAGFVRDRPIYVEWEKPENKMRFIRSRDTVKKSDYTKVKNICFTITEGSSSGDNIFPDIPKLFPNAVNIIYIPDILTAPFNVIPEYVTEICFRISKLDTPIIYSEKHRIKKISMETTKIAENENFRLPPYFDEFCLFFSSPPSVYPNVRILNIVLITFKTKTKQANQIYDFGIFPVTLEILRIYVHGCMNSDFDKIVLDNLPPMLREIHYIESETENNIEIVYTPNLKKVVRNNDIIYYRN